MHISEQGKFEISQNQGFNRKYGMNYTKKENAKKERKNIQKNYE